MFQRCLNNLGGDCTGKPQPFEEEVTVLVAGRDKKGNPKTETYTRLRCKLDNKTCGRYSVLQPDPNIVGNSYHYTVKAERKSKKAKVK